MRYDGGSCEFADPDNPTEEMLCNVAFILSLLEARAILCPNTLYTTFRTALTLCLYHVPGSILCLVRRLRAHGGSQHAKIHLL